MATLDNDTHHAVMHVVDCGIDADNVGDQKPLYGIWLLLWNPFRVFTGMLPLYLY